MMNSRYILIDTSVFCRAVDFEEFKGVNLITLIDRIWKECYTWVLNNKLIREYQDCLISRGLEGNNSVWRFINRLGEKGAQITIISEDVEACLQKHSFLNPIDEDVPHIMAASRFNVKYAIFIDEDVEIRKEQIKKHFGVEIINPKMYIELHDNEFCTATRIPFPFPS